ncbi:MAG: hypothetical protein E6J78_07575 [Deltaproteobacteria bacterium]|nr:MAG: hypothetical protein E6J78_07575 [Deltaproteobacteria bacterium]
MRAFAAAAFALLLASAARADDTAAPVIEHKPVTSAERGAKFVQVFARITDQSKFFPQVFYRYGPGEYLKPIDMKRLQGQKDVWGANVPVKGDLIEYYIEAYDEYGNGPGRAGDPDKPFRIDTSGEGGVAPPPVAKTQPAPAPPAEAVTPPPVRPLPPLAETTARAPSGGRTWTWIAGGAGVGLLTGGLLAGVAFKKADDAYQKRLSDPQNGAVSLQQQYDANKSLGTTATILSIAGVVLVGTGVALWFYESPRESAKPDRGSGIYGKGESEHGVAVAAAPVDGGGAIAVAGKF